MERLKFVELVARYLNNYPVVAVLGPRQCGKTTLAKEYIKNQDSVHYFDLDNISNLAALDNPLIALERLEGLIVIDEVQKRPDLFSSIRYLVDNCGVKQRFLILGSASRELLQQTSETLAGRIAYVELTPFSYGEVEDINKLWLRGGFPLSYLAKTIEDSIEWREFYIATFLEQDIPNLGFKIAPLALRRAWVMLAHYHGNVVNFSEIGRSLGVSDNTVRYYLNILSGTYMVRQLQPWFENIKKRQVKSPKIYFRDSGILHQILDISVLEVLNMHPKLGASWEGFAIEEVIRSLELKHHQCYFWATHSGAEIDLLVIKNGKKIGFEVKYTDHPKVTKSMRIAMQDLQLDMLYVLYPGKDDFVLDENIQVYSLESYLNVL